MGTEIQIGRTGVTTLPMPTVLPKVGPASAVRA